ncbi:MAG: BolA family transcriptional regulator [Sphingomonadaceae bacterium]|uniref:BolA family transcriptional regulator n=1 Tax=Thermaurantiacus sp. TaxID=2820283 RepID=UPI00298ED5D2|nr:BolA family transcriptional regulator [Thermaurantiacus sp.]MCS6985879.1 BolA family transcriptional regulator [Sphingomonadaceae bacterium]MDW8413852.1 BolA family transcriptional regulator [Thermaurantiacus sp.]
MPMSADELIRRIRSALPDCEVELVDLAGDDDHWEARVTSARFQGLSRVAQHRLVYEALGDDMGSRLHALKLVTIPRPS